MGREDLITISNPMSPIAEAYRTLRTNIQFSSIDKKVQVVCVTSTGPGEGKSTVASNLAVVTGEEDAAYRLRPEEAKAAQDFRCFKREGTFKPSGRGVNLRSCCTEDRGG
jgi:hypothetical protein